MCLNLNAVKQLPTNRDECLPNLPKILKADMSSGLSKMVFVGGLPNRMKSFQTLSRKFFCEHLEHTPMLLFENSANAAFGCAKFSHTLLKTRDSING